MKIAMFSDTFPPEINGVSTSTKSLLDVLRKNGHEVLMVTTNPFEDKLSYNVNEQLLRVPGHKLKMIYDYRLVNPMDLPLAKKIEKIIKEFKPDVIHVQTEWGVCIIGQRIALKYDIPLVYTYHTMWEEYASYVTGDHFNRAARAILRWYSKRMINRCLEFIAPSIKTKDYMRSIGINNYINVIPTGIDFSLFSNNNEEEVKKIRKELSINKGAKVFLSLGRIAPEKSVDVLIRGYANFRLSHPEVDSVFVIVGGGPSLPDLIALSESLHIKEAVKFTGPISRDKVPLYYQLSDLYLSASLSETQGLTYMEAMASSLIPIARFDNNLLDVIIDQKTGFYFHNEEDFSRVLYRALKLDDEEKEKMVIEGKKCIDTYSIDKFYQRVIKVYERAVQKNW